MDLFNNFSSIADKVFSFLPKSPFSSFISALNNIPYLGYLNYFIPVAQMVAIGEAWLAAIAVFYIYQIVLRWVRAIS